MIEPNEGVLYADTSALVKLVVREAESDAIEAEVARWDLIATADIAALNCRGRQLGPVPMGAPASPTGELS